MQPITKMDCTQFAKRKASDLKELCVCSIKGAATLHTINKVYGNGLLLRSSNGTKQMVTYEDLIDSWHFGTYKGEVKVREAEIEATKKKKKVLTEEERLEVEEARERVRLEELAKRKEKEAEETEEKEAAVKEEKAAKKKAAAVAKAEEKTETEDAEKALEKELEKVEAESNV